MRSFAPVKRIAAIVERGLDGVIVPPHRAAATLFLDAVDTAFQCKAADVVHEVAETKDIAHVAGVFGDAVIVLIDLRMIVEVIGNR